MKMSGRRPVTGVPSASIADVPSAAQPSRGATAAAARHVLGMLAAELAYAGLYVSCCQTEALSAAIELECDDLATLESERSLAT